MDRRSPRHINALLLVSIVLWLGAGAISLLAISDANSPLQFGLFFTALTLTVFIFRSGRHELFLSPLYALGVLVLLFYGLGPAVYLQFFPDPPASSSVLGHTMTAAYVNSVAETYVLQFAALCLCAATIVLKLRRNAHPEFRPSTEDQRQRYAAIFAPALVIICTGLFAAGRWHPATAAFMSEGIGRELNHALAPATALGCISMAYFSRHRPIAYRLATAAILIGSTSVMIFSTSLAFIAVYIALAAITVYAFAGGASLKRLAIAASIIVALVLSALTLTLTVRTHGWVNETPQASSDKVFPLIMGKIFQRQGVSGYCLDRVIRLYRGAENTNPFYFTAAIIPRILWKEKPNLSRGPEFGEIYCGQHGSVARGHNESITLIGEPLLHAGIAGLIVAQMFLVILLAGISLIGTSGSPLYLIVMATLLPWTATFQPNFAQYFGTMVKVFLTLSPLFICLGWCLRYRPQHRPIER